MLEEIQSYGILFACIKSDEFGSKYREKENFSFSLIFNA